MPLLVGLFLLALGVVLVLADGQAPLSVGHATLLAAIVALVVLPVERRVRR
jgi:ribose/xylose/arabinose/galactoside ABC-type transport system permease subunit